MYAAIWLLDPDPGKVDLVTQKFDVFEDLQFDLEGYLKAVVDIQWRDR